jgi:hypothetical protein
MTTQGRSCAARNSVGAKPHLRTCPVAMGVSGECGNRVGGVQPVFRAAARSESSCDAKGTEVTSAARMRSPRATRLGSPIKQGVSSQRTPLLSYERNSVLRLL